jgi:hypothetical protein
MNTTRRYFYRCNDCLTVAVTEVELKPVYNDRGYAEYATCDACGGNCEYMGKTSGSFMVRTQLECPCDGRCTGAIGPSCDCSCGGENHGSGRLVEVVVEVGKLPRLKIAPDACKKAEEFRALVTQVKAAWDARYKRVFELKRESYLNQGQYSLYCDGVRSWEAIRRAKSIAVHGTRMKRLAKLLEVAV